MFNRERKTGHHSTNTKEFVALFKEYWASLIILDALPLNEDRQSRQDLVSIAHKVNAQLLI